MSGRGQGRVETVREALRGEGASTGTTFMRGLTLGALIGAAVAGSAIWQRRGRRRLQLDGAVRRTVLPNGLQIVTEDIRSTNTYALVPFHLGQELYEREGARLTGLAASIARDVADQVLFLDGGVVAERGGAEVLTDPREERTQRFLSRVLDAG